MTADGTSSTPAVLPAAAGPRVAGLLAGPARPARVLHRGRHALYVELDGWCLGLVSRHAAAVPCALVLPRASLGQLAATSRAQVGAGVVQLYGPDDRRVDVRAGRLVDVAVPALTQLPSAEAVRRLRLAARLASAELDRDGSGPLVVRGELATHRLLGRGSGLTPLGDDVVCGWTAAAYALGHHLPTLPVDPRERTTLFSATLVDCAHRGEVLPEFGDLVRALATHDPADIEQAGAALARVGHTSGSGLLLGACLLFDELRSRHEGICA